MDEVAICNLALGWLGANLITSLDDDQVEARLCKANYDPSRRAVLEPVAWTFALKEYDTSSGTPSPVNEYSRVFGLPNDVLRVVRVTTNYLPIQWERRGADVLADADKVEILYVADNEDTSWFSPLFVQALAARLAMDMAIPMTNSRSLQADMAAMYSRKMVEAMSSDQRQGRAQQIRGDRLTRVR